jgi:hypothetical protein
MLCALPPSAAISNRFIGILVYYVEGVENIPEMELSSSSSVACSECRAGVGDDCKDTCWVWP